MKTENITTTDNIFSGLKVVDLSSFVAGPGAAVILSDFGADVIKVEPPKGELWRIGNKIPPQPLSNVPYMWNLNNRNKRGITLDLKSPDAVKVLERLAKWADVFIVNTPHPAREKLKLSYDDVAPWNPRLIYADMAIRRDRRCAIRRWIVCRHRDGSISARTDWQRFLRYHFAFGRRRLVRRRRDSSRACGRQVLAAARPKKSGQRRDECLQKF